MTIFSNKSFFAVFDIFGILVNQVFVWLVFIYFLFPIINQSGDGLGFVPTPLLLLINAIEIYRIYQYLPNNFLKIDNQKVELQFFKGFAKKYYVFNYNEISLIKGCFVAISNGNGGRRKVFYFSIFKDLEVVNIPQSIWQNSNRVEKIFEILQKNNPSLNLEISEKDLFFLKNKERENYTFVYFFLFLILTFLISKFNLFR